MKQSKGTSAWKTVRNFLRSHRVQQLLIRVGAISGLVALVWVAYLAGMMRVEQRRTEELSMQLRSQASEPTQLIEKSSADIVQDSSAQQPEQPQQTPEVWTRMAGLNVWIAGRREAEGEHKPRIVVMLHGYGKPRESLLMIAEREALKYGTVFVFPEAPVALDWRRRAWWRPKVPLGGKGGNGNGLRAGRRIKTIVPDQELLAARQRITGLLDEVKKRFNVENSEIILAGFSQGATLALDVALNMNTSLGGLAFLSGKPLEQSEGWAVYKRLRNSPVLVAHGRYDPMASFAGADKMRRAMRRAGVQVTWVPYEGGHDIGQAAQLQLRRFIREPGPSASEPHAGSDEEPSQGSVW